MNLLNDIIGWDIRNWSRCLPYWQGWLEALDPRTARVLVLGERNGGISLWFARLGFEVLCTDYRPPSPQVQSLHQRWDVQARIKYARADIFKLDYPDDSFDVAACKSVLGGLALDYKDRATRTLENQKLAVLEVKRVLKRGGLFLGAENLAGTGLHMLIRKLRARGNLGWRYLAKPEVRWLFDGYSQCEQKLHGFLGTQWGGGRAVNGFCASADGLLSKTLPDRWLYISFIRARK